jgi:MFS family permease
MKKSAVDPPGSADPQGAAERGVSNLKDPPDRWRALAQLAVAAVLAMTTWFSATAVLPQLRSEWNLSSTAGALLTISVQLGFVVGALTSAGLNLADLIPPRRLFLLGALGAAVVNTLLILSSGPSTAIPLRFATGAFLAAVYPPALKSIATWFKRGRGLALGLMVGALVLGQAAPHLINGLGGANWRIVITVTSVLTLAGGLIAEFIAKDGPFPFPRGVFDPGQAGRVFADRGVRLASFGYFGHMWELFAMLAWFAVFFGDALALHGISDPRPGAAFATFAVIASGAAGCWVGGILGDRWGRSKTTVLAMAVSATCAVLIGLTRTGPIPVMLTVGLIWGFWVVADSAQFSTIVTEVADQSYVGTALTLQLALGFVLTVITIWLVPVLQDRLTWRWAFAFLAPGPLLGVVAMLRLMRSPQAAKIAGGLG